MEVISSVLSYKHLDRKLQMLLTIFTVAMITLIGKKIITTCGTIIGRCSLLIIIVTITDEGWKY